MSENSDSSAKINFKQAIIVALITSTTTIVVTLISINGNKTKSPPSVDCDIHKERVVELTAELNQSVSAENLSDISNRFFKNRDGTEVLKDSLRNVVFLAEAHLDDQKHYAYNLFALKKILIGKPRGNINTRIEDDDKNTYALIQQILKNIQFYSGEISGNRQDTFMALRGFQLKLNEATENYFADSNLGILGNKTYIALMEYYEHSN